MRFCHVFTGRVPTPLYWLSRRTVPIACVDILPRKLGPGGITIGLIRRPMKRNGSVWALVGGGVQRGENLAEAIERHISTTLGSSITWIQPETALPKLVAEYFPWERPGHGLDSRKHAIALTYVVDVDGQPEAIGEAVEFDWFTLTTLPPATEFWHGQYAIVMKLVASLEQGERQTE